MGASEQRRRARRKADLHVLDRARERYGLALHVTDVRKMSELIQLGTVPPFMAPRDDLGVGIFEVEIEQKRVFALWSTRLNYVVTLLTRDMATRMRANPKGRYY